MLEGPHGDQGVLGSLHRDSRVLEARFQTVGLGGHLTGDELELGLRTLGDWIGFLSAHKHSKVRRSNLLVLNQSLHYRRVAFGNFVI